jgi:hypothetical protein
MHSLQSNKPQLIILILVWIDWKRGNLIDQNGMIRQTLVVRQLKV